MTIVKNSGRVTIDMSIEEATELNLEINGVMESLGECSSVGYSTDLLDSVSAELCNIILSD